MTAIARKADLSPPRRRLLELLSNVNYGRLEHVLIRAGQPIFDPPPRVVRLVKFSADSGPRPEVHFADFPLRAQHLELFDYMDRRRDFEIESLEVQAGLPYRMALPEPVR